MREVISMVLAGGRVEELSVLTLHRPKAAVPFGGQYRIIDFALSSLMQADIQRVGVLSLYRPSSLIDHVGVGEPWDMVGRGRGVRILPPYMSAGDLPGDSQWYQGTADAIYKNLAFVRKFNPRDVMVLSGDHIYGMDFRPLFQQHRETQADLTMVVKPFPVPVPGGRFGLAEVDECSRVIGYQEKPEKPRSNLVSLTIYLFKTEKLLARLEENHRFGSAHQLYSEVIPQMVEKDKVYAFRYNGYWNYARSLDAFHSANMDLLGEDPSIDPNAWGVRTRKQYLGLGDFPPARFLGEGGCVDSVISPGVILEGTVVRSVLSPGVRIEPGARVTDSVLMNDVVVRKGALIEKAILDKGVVVGAHAHVGEGKRHLPNEEVSQGFNSGICVVGKNAVVPVKAKIRRHCVIYPDVSENDWRELVLKSGTCLRPEKGGWT